MSLFTFSSIFPYLRCSLDWEGALLSMQNVRSNFMPFPCPSLPPITCHAERHANPIEQNSKSCTVFIEPKHALIGSEKSS